MGSPVRVGIAGLGRIARSHAAGYGALGGQAVIAAVCDVDGQRARDFATEFGGRPVTDLGELIDDPSIDAIDLILPHMEHREAALAVLGAGKHLLIEKPLAPTYRESMEIRDAGSRAGVVFMVAENTRYVGAYQAAERLLRDGAIGSVNNARTFLSSNMKVRLARPDFWGRTYETGGGLILDSAPHSFYLLKWLLGDFTEVQTSMAQVFPIDVEIEDIAEVTGSLAGGAHFLCGFSAVSEIPHSERLELFGTEGAIIVDQTADPVVKLYRGSRDHRGSTVPDVPYGPDGWRPGGWHYESVVAEVADFVGAIRDGRAPLIEALDCAYSIAVVEAAYAAARARAPVPVRAE